MHHPDEKTLELYALGAAEVMERRPEIEAHLTECAGCRALLQEISEYYEDVKQLQLEKTEAATQALTLRNWIVHARTIEDKVPLRPVRRSVPLRMAIFVVRHPIVSSGSFLAIFLAGALLLTIPKKDSKDPNPAYARAKDEFLIAYNKDGEELWRKHFGFGYNYDEQDMNTPGKPPLDQLLVTMDLEGDGKNQVVTLCWGEPNSPLRNTIFCYNADGIERWKYELHRTITFGSQRYSDDYLFTRMIVGDFDHDGVPEVIALAQHLPDFPCIVVRLDARNGKFLGEYWHPGYLLALEHTDLDGDVVQEILLGGVSNAYAQPALAILDPRKIGGHAPATVKYIPQDVQEGAEKYYLLFPHTDLAKFAADVKGTVGEIRIAADGLIEVGTGEIMADNRPYGPMYYFDSKMKVVKLLPEVGFEALHKRLEAEGKLTRKLNEQYYKELIEGVRYWDGEKFVKEPTRNRRYVESMKRLP